MPSAEHGFHHRDHLRLAWEHIRQLGEEEASREVTQAIRHMARKHDQSERYNETMTRFWLRAVAIGIARHPTLSFDALLESEPHLMDKVLPFRHWSRERLMGDDAKAAWVEPDLIPLPA
jgi:hypothetical protein